MKHAEFLDLMLNLERAINNLSRALEDELYEDAIAKSSDIDKWMAAYNANSLAKGLTATKCAISTFHDIAYGKE